MKKLRQKWEKIYVALLQDNTNEDLMDKLISIEASMVRRILCEKGNRRPSKEEVISTHEEIKKTLVI